MLLAVTCIHPSPWESQVGARARDATPHGCGITPLLFPENTDNSELRFYQFYFLDFLSFFFPGPCWSHVCAGKRHGVSTRNTKSQPGHQPESLKAFHVTGQIPWTHHQSLAFWPKPHPITMDTAALKGPAWLGCLS